MEGVGRVFGLYRDGVTSADDEVALAHGTPADGYRPLSEPLVNIRLALADAVEERVIEAVTGNALLEASRVRFYPERAWGRLYEDAERLGVAEEERARLRAWVAATRPNAKRDDAADALRAASEEKETRVPSFTFERTVFWQRLVRTTARAGGGAEPTMAADVLRRARVTLDDWRNLTRLALLNELVGIEAQLMGITATPDEIGSAAQRFRRERGLSSATATREWLAREGLSEREFTERMRLDVLTDKLLDSFETALRREGSVALELKSQGRFSALTLEAAREREKLARHGADDDISEVDLVAWYERRFRPIAGTLEEEARWRGFGSRIEPLDEMRRVFLSER